MAALSTEGRGLNSQSTQTTFSQHTLMGITDGFCIGFNHRHSLHLSLKNLPTKNLSVIGNYLDREVQLGGMHRHVVSHSGVKWSPQGAIPKKNKPGKWCLIMDLSSPAESSVNDSMYIA